MKYKIVHLEEWEQLTKTIEKISQYDRYIHSVKKIKQTNNDINQDVELNYQIIDNEYSDEETYLKNGVNKKALKKAKNIAPFFYLDLHGFSADSAYYALHDFINKAYINQQRYVYIIHGKGLSSKDNVPVLKPKVLMWLRNISIVLAFTSAKESYGGSGATVVLLKN